jgi:hypothetical protein
MTRINHYIITTVKHAIWLVNSRAGSGYPARGIKMPSRDFRGTLKMSLFHCSYFIKHLPNGFPSRIAWSMHLGCCSTFGKRKNTLACGSSIIIRFPKVSRHPSCMDHAILHGKPFGIPLFNDRKILTSYTAHPSMPLPNFSIQISIHNAPCASLNRVPCASLNIVVGFSKENYGKFSYINWKLDWNVL